MTTLIHGPYNHQHAPFLYFSPNHEWGDHKPHPSLFFPISPSYEGIIIGNTTDNIPYLACSFDLFRSAERKPIEVSSLIEKYFSFLSKQYDDKQHLTVSVVMNPAPDSLVIGQFKKGATLNGICLFKDRGEGACDFLIHPATQSNTIHNYSWEKNDIIISASADLWALLHIKRIRSIVRSNFIHNLPSVLKASAINASCMKNPKRAPSIAIAIWVHPDTELDSDEDLN